MTKKTFGSVMRGLREAQGLSMRALGRAADIDVAYVMKLEADERRPSPAVLARLAKVLKANAEELQALAVVNLPRFAPYLRAKYDLSDDQVAELEMHFAAVRKKPKTKRGQP